MNIAVLIDILEDDAKRSIEEAIKEQNKGHWESAQHYLGIAEEAKKVWDLIKGGWI